MCGQLTGHVARRGWAVHGGPGRGAWSTGPWWTGAGSGERTVSGGAWPRRRFGRPRVELAARCCGAREAVPRARTRRLRRGGYGAQAGRAEERPRRVGFAAGRRLGGGHLRQGRARERERERRWGRVRRVAHLRAELRGRFASSGTRRPMGSTAAGTFTRQRARFWWQRDLGQGSGAARASKGGAGCSRGFL